MSNPTDTKRTVVLHTLIGGSPFKGRRTKVIEALQTEGLIDSKGCITEAGLAAIGHHLIPCDGEAHGNPHIDNCSMCAPRWGKVAVPVQFKDLNAWREDLEARADI